MLTQRGSKDIMDVIFLQDSATASVGKLITFAFVVFCVAVLSHPLWARQPHLTSLNDYDGDLKTDLAVYSPSTQTWSIQSSLNPGGNFTCQWGTASDIRVPGDYDGDGNTDVAVFQPGTGTWYVLPSSNPGTYTATQWGSSTDIPVPGDYDDDGKTDIAFWRPSTGIWYILPSSAPGTHTETQWGSSTDVPIPGDYDGDGNTDIAVFRPSTGTWYVLPSSNPGTYTATQWGLSTDQLVPGDYDGDDKTDIAFWRPSTGTWYILPSGAPGTYTETQWGSNTDVPVPGDYDGDGKTDAAVWRPSTGTWYILPSTAPGTYTSTQWGTSADLPVYVAPIFVPATLTRTELSYDSRNARGNYSFVPYFGGVGQVNLVNGNLVFSRQLFTRPGRAGMALDLSMVYNSKIWTRTGGNQMGISDPGSYVGLGWRIGFPYLVHGTSSYALVLTDGSSHEIMDYGSGNWKSVDSTYIILDPATPEATLKGGTRLIFGNTVGAISYLTEICDRNGNQIFILSIRHRKAQHHQRYPREHLTGCEFLLLGRRDAGAYRVDE